MTGPGIGDTRHVRGRLLPVQPIWCPQAACPTCGHALVPVRVQTCDGHRLEHHTTWRCPNRHAVDPGQEIHL